MFPKDIQLYKTTPTLVMGWLFLAAAIGCFAAIGYRFHVLANLQNAIQVPGHIIKVESKNSKTRAEYQYEFAGRVYRSERLSVFSQSGGLYWRLNAVLRSGDAVTCYLDRNNPEYSVLEKDWRILDVLAALFFGSVFGYVGPLYLVKYFSTPEPTDHRTHNKTPQSTGIAPPNSNQPRS